MKKILFTGGGSAGHIVPNLALINEMKRQGAYAFYYLGSGGMEKRLLAKTDVPFFETDCPKLIRSFTFKNLTIPLRLYKAVAAARKILKELRPQVVFSKGGFVALPVCLAAAKEKIPVITHESDLSAGLTTKLIAKKCVFVLTSFPETAKKLKNGKFTGTPLRSELFTKKKAELPASFFKKPVLLVFGGSQGSAAINGAVENRLAELLKTYSVIHVAGRKNYAAGQEKSLKTAYEQAAKTGYLRLPYAENMGALYAAADLVLSRAGSNTLFEIVALKKPSLIVPLAKGSRGDQQENAEYFLRKGWIHVLDERDLEKDLLAELSKTQSDEKLKERLLRANVESGNNKIVQTITEVLQKSP